MAAEIEALRHRQEMHDVAFAAMVAALANLAVARGAFTASEVIEKLRKTAANLRAAAAAEGLEPIGVDLIDKVAANIRAGMIDGLKIDDVGCGNSMTNSRAN